MIWKASGFVMATVWRQEHSGIWRSARCVSLAAALAAASPALAQSPGATPEGALFDPPEGCSVFMTLQSRGCRVANHYRCDADPAGDQWRADFDQEGIFFVSHTDYETQWVESFDFFPITRQSLDPGAADPASFSELLAKGLDTFDFNLTKDDGSHSHVTGHDRLTGKTVTIDGIELQETEFSFSEAAEDGTVLRSAKGNEYIKADWRMFFSGPSEWVTEEGNLPVDGSPLQFIFPGEPGFRTTEPLFDCDAVLSRAEGAAPILPASVRK